MGNINTQFRNLRVDNLIRTAELRPSKAAAHFRNTLGLLRGFDKFRIGIFVFPIHIFWLRRPDSNGEYKCQKLGCYRYTTAQNVIVQDKAFVRLLSFAYRRISCRF